MDESDHRISFNLLTESAISLLATIEASGLDDFKKSTTSLQEVIKA
jgi:hypothetical protein